MPTSTPEPLRKLKRKQSKSSLLKPVPTIVTLATGGQYIYL